VRIDLTTPHSTLHRLPKDKERVSTRLKVRELIRKRKKKKGEKWGHFEGRPQAGPLTLNLIEGHNNKGVSWRVWLG
jgi:hypothetical protein